MVVVVVTVIVIVVVVVVVTYYLLLLGSLPKSSYMFLLEVLVLVQYSTAKAGIMTTPPGCGHCN